MVEMGPKSLNKLISHYRKAFCDLESDQGWKSSTETAMAILAGQMENLKIQSGRYTHVRTPGPKNEFKIPAKGLSPEEVVAMLSRVLDGLPVWGHRGVVKNVVSGVTQASLSGLWISGLGNPNMSSEEYACGFSRVELEVVDAMAELVGYSPKRAGGIFSFGGTSAMLYALRMALVHKVPAYLSRGIQGPVYIIGSEHAHYAKETAASWMGLGTDQVIHIPVKPDFSMDLVKLNDWVRTLLSSGKTIGCVVVTLGTTDTFALDPVEEILVLREQWKRDFGEAGNVHLHADAVISWPWLFFKDYPFLANPLELSSQTLLHLETIMEPLTHIRSLDTVGIDFHKTGFCPYPSSLFLCKDKRQLVAISIKQDIAPYLYHAPTQIHPGLYSLECSRSSAGAMTACASLASLGKEGFQTLLAYATELTNLLRRELCAIPYIQIANKENLGPVTLIRCYPRQLSEKAKHLFHLERSASCSSDLSSQLNQFQEQLLKRCSHASANQSGIQLSLTHGIKNKKGFPLTCLKIYLLSPFVEKPDVGKVVQKLQFCAKAIESQTFKGLKELAASLQDSAELHPP
jgi:glutamate/tyrosine decarboxylase-like PLP-dependent enzyme